MCPGASLSSSEDAVGRLSVPGPASAWAPCGGNTLLHLHAWPRRLDPGRPSLPSSTEDKAGYTFHISAPTSPPFKNYKIGVVPRITFKTNKLLFHLVTVQLALLPICPKLLTAWLNSPWPCRVYTCWHDFFPTSHDPEAWKFRSILTSPEDLLFLM